jgi:glycosyltransferase involved in cell wall biosynthesis
MTLARARGLAPSMEMAAALCFEGQIATELRAEGIPVSMIGEVRLRRPDSVFRARQALAAVLKRERHDLVVCHQAWPQAIFGPVAKAAGIPLVLWVHMAQSGHHWLERLASRVEPDLIVCNSHFTASTMPKTTTRVEVVYYPGASAIAGVGGVEGARGAEGEVVIIQVSRMESLKGQKVLIEALGSLRAVPDWVCWQTGGAQRPQEQRYLDSLRADADRLGVADRIRFLGQRQDIAALLAQADIYCQPNLAPEGFGLTFIEALSAGLPVVTSAIGGALEIVDETCGRLVPPNDPAALAIELERLVGDRAERKRLGRAGPARARALCNPAVQMPRIAQVLERASCGSRAAR